MTEQEMDRMLDTALETYVAEAPADLAPRVLARIRRPQMRWVPWLAAAAALAVVTLAVVGHRGGDSTPASKPQPVVAQAAAPVPAPTVAKPAVARRSTPVPRPSRPRLTNEEQQLVSLVTNHPELIAQAWEPAPAPAWPEPVAIPPIQIEPLTHAQ